MLKSADGHPLTVQFDRKRYGTGTFCWAYLVTADGTSISLGDPWPAVKWPHSLLVPLAQRADARHRKTLAEASGDTAGAAALAAMEEAAEKQALDAERAQLERKAGTSVPKVAA